MTYEQNYLAHFGIKGQKWGVRRFQNEDGTLTNAGKQRYGDDNSEVKNWKKSDVKQLSDEELRRRNNRLQAERQYRDLTTTDSERERNQFRKDLVRKLMVVPVLAVAGIAGRKYIGKGADFLGKKISKYGKQTIGKIKTNGLLKEAANRGHEKYFKERRIKQFMPRPWSKKRVFDLVEKKPPLWRKASRGWPNI